MTSITGQFPTTADGLRAAFGKCASSTWVITSGLNEEPAGFTAISVVSVSMDPPMVSFNLAKGASSRAAIEDGRHVALHLLADHQEGLARTFAGPKHLRFADESSWQWDHDGLPALTTYLSRLSARVVNLFEAGDSLIVTAEVEVVEQGSGSPLVHHDTDFRALTAPYPAHYVLRGA